MNFMRTNDRNRVVFHTVHDLSSGYHLQKSESILENINHSHSTNINDVLECYSVKLYIDSGVQLKHWTPVQMENYRKKVLEYGRTLGKFLSNINNLNFFDHYSTLLREYVPLFWELISKQNAYKRISDNTIEKVLIAEPYTVREILKHRNLVKNYDLTIKKLLLNYPKSAEILLSIYEVENFFSSEKLCLPDSLTNADKEEIISGYIDYHDCNSNYLPIIHNSKKSSDFSVSDKTRLKAKRKQQELNKKFFEDSSKASIYKFGISINYSENTKTIRQYKTDDSITYCTYSLDYIKAASDAYSFYLNFITLFEYIDEQRRITLVSKKRSFGILESLMGIRSRNHYHCGISYNFADSLSKLQIYTYSKILSSLQSSLEQVLQQVYNNIFQSKYSYAHNAFLMMPSENSSALEKVRSIAPELESILKQYKLFVEDGAIDFELLQMSSSPLPIKEVPSLNKKKYLYINEKNTDFAFAIELFFSNQSMLMYVEPFKEKNYESFFELLSEEENVKLDKFESYQSEKLKYLIEMKYIFIDIEGSIRLTSEIRILIMKDLFENEVSSFHCYPYNAQKEALKMIDEGLIYFEDSLFSKPEQDYFNYHLNKSEFTNGIDLRNSYLHGTQAHAKETKKHEDSYIIYLKLIILVLLKIEDDLSLNKHKIRS